MMRLKGDSLVNHTLDSRLEREGEWTKKHSTIVECERIFQNNIDQNNFFMPTPENTFDVQVSRNIEIVKAKKAIQQTIQEETLEYWNRPHSRPSVSGPGVYNMS